MVRGLQKFKAFFCDFANNYVIIGGTACDIYEEQFAQTPRATKDLDIILIVEALSSEFVAKFWEFVRTGNYATRQKGEGKNEYYRFMNPKDMAYPQQVELFSRSLGLINFPADARITPISVDEDLSSLSAILMNDDYYNFTIEHSIIEDGIHLASRESLICLKSKAYLDLAERKSSGEFIDSKQIEKHKKDILRLTAMFAPDEKYIIPDALKTDVAAFCVSVKENLPNADFFKSIGLSGITGEQLLAQLKKSFLI